MNDGVHRSVVNGIRQRWKALTLARQFAVAGGGVLLMGMLLIGIWVTGQIEDGVVRNTASATALYVDSVIAPLLVNVPEKDTLSAGARRALDETLGQGALGKRLYSFKIWNDQDHVAYSSQPELTGSRFPLTDSLRSAWAGHMAAEFNGLDDQENALERAANRPLLEIYSPIREPWSGKIVAVAEFYEIAEELEANLLQARLRSWLVVAGVTLCMLGLLFGIVLRGSRMIGSQKMALEAQVADLSNLLRQNETLRLRLQRASSRSTAINERFLRRISADLHDGPAQLLAFASLKMGSTKLAAIAPQAKEEIETIRGSLDEAMRDIRDICRGLTLPYIESAALDEFLRAAVAAHEQRTGTSVRLTLPRAAPDLSHAQKICIFRCVQEGLNNAFRHAGGVGQSVEATVENGHLKVSVADCGSGFSVDAASGEGLGLAGLRERVESLGDEFEVTSSASGTRLTVTLRLDERESV